MEMYGRPTDRRQGDWSQQRSITMTGDSMRMLNLWEREVYPDRPGQPDCAYYLRTGSCGYGAKCRFHHPQDRGSELGGGEYPERIGEPACQYYLRTGTCKFGSSCRFNHPKNAGGSSIKVPLNLYGYPLRSGEKVCSYYLKTGQCKFGITCKFDHPQIAGSSVPASARPFYPSVQSLSSVSPDQFDASSTNYRVARSPPLIPGSYMAGSYGPMLLHPGVVPISNWNPYSGAVSTSPSSGPQPYPSGTYPQLPSSTNVNKEHSFPERPDEPDCKFFMRTGDCKYGASCRYNHPSDWFISKTNCALSPLGLPLRPGIQTCSFYMQKGQCKFGRTCKFDHPMVNVKYSPSSSYSEMPG